MEKIKLQIKRKQGCKDLPLPSYMSEGASGMDLYADVEKETFIAPGQIKLISSGIHVSLPIGYEAQVRPRSGLALKHGISIVNAPGTIDSDYRGVVGVILINLGGEPFKISRGDRIAQMVVKSVTRANLEEVIELDETVRSEGGFGHTGI
ncbi:MAG: dUTP diphosphatase [Candidatus Omnitrophota bacterium]